MLAFRLELEDSSPGAAIHSIALHALIQIEAPRRRYSAAEQERLADLFGEPERWGQTLRPMLWTHADVTVPAFSGSVAVDLRVPCSFDFNLAATKYFYGLSDGDIPLMFLFSGSCFYAGAAGGLEVAPIPWSKEARFRLPAVVWREIMDSYYPNSAWLRIRQDVFDRLDSIQIASRCRHLGRSAGALAGAGARMTTVEQIADAVLYEGYILYPYRASALKNGQRWNFGVLYPPSYAASQQGSDDVGHADANAWRGQSDSNVTVRFLQL